MYQIDDPNKFLNFLIMGYAVMSLIALIYVASLASRQRNAQKDIELLNRLLDED